MGLEVPEAPQVMKIGSTLSLLLVCTLATACAAGHRPSGLHGGGIHVVHCEDSNAGCYKQAAAICAGGYEVKETSNWRTGACCDYGFKYFFFPGRKYQLAFACLPVKIGDGPESSKSKVVQQCIDRCVALSGQTRDECFYQCIG